MNDQRPIAFKAGAFDYLILTVLSIILIYIPFLGWAYLLNFSGEWFAKHSKITGKEIAFKAGFGESLKFVSINVVLLLITFGIYSLWFYPKLYRYMAEHVHFAEQSAPQVSEPVLAAPVDPAINPTVAAPSQPIVTAPAQQTTAPETIAPTIMPVSDPVVSQPNQDTQNSQNPQV